MAATHKLTSQERRAAIVDSAMKLFSEKGFRGTTTRELAASVGVTEPVLYQHFATKNDLYSAIIDSKSHAVEKVVGEMERFLDTADDRAFFTHLGSLILHFYDKDPPFLRLLLFSALERHELSDLFHERQSCSFERPIIRYIEKRVEQGAFRRFDPALIAHSFMGMVANYGMNRMLYPSKVSSLPREVLIEGMVDIFLKGIERN